MKKLILSAAAAMLLTGCTETVYQSVIAPNIDIQLEKAGYSSEDRESVERIGGAVVKSMEDLTPEQEYYIGRTIAANLLTQYQPYNDAAARDYVNKIGMLLTYYSDQPTTFGGYHFEILDSDEINAFAAPGGFIFVTRGMLRCTDSEDAVAAILAHEISHITHRHGLSAIKSSRWTKVGTLLGVEAAKRYTSEEVASLVTVFEESIDDVIQTLVVNGYSREQEREADRSAVKILTKAGYDAGALVNMLKLMKQRLHPGGHDFASTHPDPLERIDDVRGSITQRTTIPSVRQQRYNLQLARI